MENINEILQKRKKLKVLIENTKKEINLIDEDLKELMLNCDQETIEIENFKITYKSIFKKTFRSKLFQAENKELYEKYVKEEEQEYFRITEKKGEEQ